MDNIIRWIVLVCTWITFIEAENDLPARHLYKRDIVRPSSLPRFFHLIFRKEPLCVVNGLPPYIFPGANSPNYPPSITPLQVSNHFGGGLDGLRYYCLYHNHCNCVGQEIGEPLKHCSFHHQETLQDGSSRSEPRYFAESLCADERFCFCFAHDSSSSEDGEESLHRNASRAAWAIHGYGGGGDSSDLMSD